MSEYTSYLNPLVKVQQCKVVVWAQVDCLPSIFWIILRKDWARSKISHHFILPKIAGFLGNY